MQTVLPYAVFARGAGLGDTHKIVGAFVYREDAEEFCKAIKEKNPVIIHEPGPEKV